MSRPLTTHALCLALAAGPGCTWVELTEAGADVETGSSRAVAGCRLVGTVTARTRNRILVERSRAKVGEELMVLARNEAATLGGDTLVAAGPAHDGRQDFNVYRCEVN